MQRNNYQWILVDSLSASAADLIVRNRCLYYKGQRLFKYDDVEPNSVIKSAAVAATAGVITFTPPTPVVGTTYTIQFLPISPDPANPISLGQ